jgi:hypothetical protein
MAGVLGAVGTFYNWGGPQRGDNFGAHLGFQLRVKFLYRFIGFFDKILRNP